MEISSMMCHVWTRTGDSYTSTLALLEQLTLRYCTAAYSTGPLCTAVPAAAYKAVSRLFASRALVSPLRFVVLSCASPTRCGCGCSTARLYEHECPSEVL